MGQVQPSGERKEELLAAYTENCKQAAKAIAEADYFLLATGAGFSADSGLAGLYYLYYQWSDPFQCTRTLLMWNLIESVV